jgi:hypothetical protein
MRMYNRGRGLWTCSTHSFSTSACHFEVYSVDIRTGLNTLWSCDRNPLSIRRHKSIESDDVSGGRVEVLRIGFRDELMLHARHRQKPQGSTSQPLYWFLSSVKRLSNTYFSQVILNAPFTSLCTVYCITWLLSVQCREKLQFIVTSNTRAVRRVR